jgi:threonine dehydratase
MVEFADIVAAHDRIRPYVRRTPVLTLNPDENPFEAEMFFKAESLQRTGSFKYRGATNAMLQISDEAREKGVLTFSSGNHAQALALAGRVHGVHVTVVMPHDAPEVKRKATEGFGAEVILYDRDETKREKLGAQLANERGLTLIPPYDHPHIVAGQGTAVKELIEDAGELDMILVCAGGGGLLSGSGISGRALSPNAEIIGVEPEAGDDICQSFATGQLVYIENPVTIADGARTPSASPLTFELIQKNVDQMLCVPDSSLIEGMKFYAERLKLVIEPTGCLSLAAILTKQVEVTGKRVGVIISGGNVDLGAYGGFIA